MSRTSEINSICLISNRKDVVEFCEQAVGALAKVFTEEKVSISLIRFSKLLILDVASIEVVVVGPMPVVYLLKHWRVVVRLEL